MRILTGPLSGAKWIVGAGIHGCWLGSFEFEKQRALETVVKPGMVVYDIGAHAGFYSLFFSRLVGPAGQVWAFEPNIDNAAYLLKHLHLNRIANVTAVPVAVGAAPQLGHFQIGADSYVGHLAPEGDYRIPTLSLDELIHQHAAPPPDLIKIDVEGAEAAVLAGAAELLREHRPIVFVAFHSDGLAIECSNRLQALGYHLHPVANLPSEVYALPA